VNVLVDTSVWSFAFRRKPEDLNLPETSIVAELRDLVKDNRALLIGPIRQEVLSGIKTLQQYEKLRTNLRAFPDEPLSTSDYESAAAANNTCRAKGIAISIVDAIICAIALDRNYSIFTTDPDFLSFAKVLPIKLYLRVN
jgi:predicted nucleic acid-binding protein